MEATALLRCRVCPYLLRKANSCPAIPQSILQGFLQLFYVLVSISPYLILLFLLLKSLSLHSSRSAPPNSIYVSGFALKINPHCFFSLACLLSVYGVSSILKNYFKHSRPEEACTLSYGNPSNHSAFTGSLTVLLIYFGLRLKRPSFLVLAIAYPICNGVARVGLHYHFWYQVFNGFAFGVLYTLPFLILYWRSFPKEKQN